MTASGIPEGMHTLTPHITVKNAAKAIEFYKQAFGAKELDRSLTPDGRIMHARVQIGDSTLMLNDEFPEMGGNTAPENGKTGLRLQLYVPDADRTFNDAVAAGALPTMPPADMFWGDRYGTVNDPFGYSWSIATR